MRTNAYLAFVGVSIAILVFPGPSTLLIAANSLRRGRTVGVYTVVGGVGAMVVQLAVALAGLTSLASASGVRFDYVRGFGAAYLVYLGLRRWRGSIDEIQARGKADSYRSALLEGFVVALTNPGTMLFFLAFFPQFLDTSEPAGPQLTLMTVTFMVLTVIVDTSYAFLAARIGNRLQDPAQTRARNRLSGGLLLLAAAVLVLVNV